MKTIKVYAIIVAFIFTVLHEIYKYLPRNILMLFMFKRYVGTYHLYLESDIVKRTQVLPHDCVKSV